MTFPMWVIRYRYLIVVSIVLVLAFVCRFASTFFDKTRPRPEPRHPQEDPGHTEKL